MDIRFLGMMAKDRDSGCRTCGGRIGSRSSEVLIKQKPIALPSGSIIDWNMNEIHSVSDTDGLYLADFTYKHNGVVNYMFEVV